MNTILKFDENEINEIVEISTNLCNVEFDEIDFYDKSIVGFVEFDEYYVYDDEFELFVNEFELNEFDDVIDYSNFKYCICSYATTNSINYFIKQIELNFMKYNLNIDIDDDYIYVKILNKIVIDENNNIDEFIDLYNKFKVLYDEFEILNLNQFVLTIKFNEIDVENVEILMKYYFNIDVEINDDIVVVAY